MNVSESWVREWVNPPVNGDQLAAQLTMAGLEVDQVMPVAPSFSGVIIARVCDTKPHPEADRLTLCEVDIGQPERLQIVCGAPNVRPELCVALAQIGAQLPGDIHIKATKLRGVLSEGMLCSTAELGIDDGSKGIMELPMDAPIGQNLRDYLQLDDHVFEIDLTPNRADCLSIQGIAREIAALNGLSCKSLVSTPVVSTTDKMLGAYINEPEASPAYAIRVIKNISLNAVIPLWMKERLRRGGISCGIHPVVDVLNYVMLELGQPMHAFDLACIKGNICVRSGHSNESLTLLNDQTITLDESVLIIADEEKPLALAGVMGGKHGSIQASSVDILLEAAFFSPVAIAGVARRYGVSSEAAQRFERGVDPQLHLTALDYATHLLTQIVGGQPGPVTYQQSANYMPVRQDIMFNPTSVVRLTGLRLSNEQMFELLTRLNMRIEREEHQQNHIWRISPPSYRFDLTLEVDLVEEILRLHGYDKLEGAPWVASLKRGEPNLKDACLRDISAYLSHDGYHETIRYSFVDPAIQRVLYPDKEAIALVNPLSSELSAMRVGLWSGLMASLLHNVNRQQTVVKCFEAGVVFEKKEGVISESLMIAGILSGEQGALNWSEPTRPYDFFDVKGVLQSLFDSIKCGPLRFVADTHPALHPGKSARLFLGDDAIGWIGLLHPRWMDLFGLAQDVVLFEFAVAPCVHQISSHYKPISKYPRIRRDLSLLVNEDIPVSTIERIVRAVTPSAQLKAFDVFDEYRGDFLPQGKKSIAIALTIQDDHRTLVDADINKLIDAILKALEEQLAIVLRD